MPDNLTVGTARPQQEGRDSTARGKSSYRPEIDGLRALAVVAVIILAAPEKWLKCSVGLG